MDRRSFIKSIGAAGLLPVLPMLAIASVAPAAAPVVSAHTYQWAEMIVRAHNKCNLGPLQRSLHISEQAASILKTQLIETGVVSAQANSYGIHTATKPLYEGAFMKVSDAADRAVDAIQEFADSPDAAQPAQEEVADTAQDSASIEAETVVDVEENAREEPVEADEEVLMVEELESTNSDTAG